MTADAGYVPFVGRVLITALCLFGTACSAGIVYFVATGTGDGLPNLIPLIMLTILLWWPRTR